MRYLFIVNPKAGDGVKTAELEKEVSQLEGCELYQTKGVKDATVYVKKYLSEHPDEEVRVIACGGDGTLNEVVNGAVGFANASVTVYPCGSGNDFVKVYGGQEKFLDVRKLMEANSRPLDLLKAGDLYSINVINFGFDTTVAITINQQREKTGHGSKSDYTKGIIKALLTSMKNSGKVTADGKLINPSGKFLLCTVANGQYVGGSFKCAPKAAVDDGLIEVCLIKPISRLRFVKILKPYTAGEHIDSPDMKDIVTYVQAKEVEVEAPKGFAYSLDGEIIYQDHFKVEIVPGAINFAVPE